MIDRVVYVFDDSSPAIYLSLSLSHSLTHTHSLRHVFPFGISGPFGQVGFETPFAYTYLRLLPCN
jgi:hypothetical protein